MPKPIEYRQETREFRNRSGALSWIISLRRKFGRKAKMFMKEVSGKVYVKARYPDTGESLGDLAREYIHHQLMGVNDGNIWK